MAGTELRAAFSSSIYYLLDADALSGHAGPNYLVSVWLGISTLPLGHHLSRSIRSVFGVPVDEVHAAITGLHRGRQSSTEREKV
jgi:hypothetical protein